MKKTILTVGGILILSGMLGGCTANDAAEHQSQHIQHVNYRGTSSIINQNYAGNATNSNTLSNNRFVDYQKHATVIADRATKTSGVNHAYVVVSMNNVLIGLQADRSVVHLKELRKAVRRSVKPIAGKRHIYVTTDARYVSQINDLQKQLTSKRGWQNLRGNANRTVDDLARLIAHPFQHASR
ncbi:MAG: YhcN/YlaJ family sporulation lipoprotein [Sporolactobacillus sp.]